MSGATRATTRRWEWWLLAAVLVGVGLRMAQYGANVPLWHDEATLVFNIVEKDAAELMGPLDAYPDAPQASPPLFLLTERGVYERWGESRLALRALPLLSGVLALGAFALLARRMFSPATAVFLALLFALSDHLIWHATEVKQYSGDVLVACVLLLMALRRPPQAGGSPAAGPRGREDADAGAAIGPVRFALCALLASMCMWFSHATVFVFAGIGLARAWEVYRSPAAGGKRGAWAGWVLWTMVPVAAFALVYILSIRAQQAPYLYEYWVKNGKMMDWSRAWMLPVWIAGNAYRLVDYPFEVASIVLAPLVGVGMWSMWRSGRWSLLLVLAGPAVLLMMTGLLQKYPFGGSRLTLFMSAHVLLLAGWGVEALWGHPWRCVEVARKWIVMACVAALLVPAGMAVKGLFDPRQRSTTTLDQLRAAMEARE